jgi:hypothetical protein
MKNSVSGGITPCSQLTTRCYIPRRQDFLRLWKPQLSGPRFEARISEIDRCANRTKAAAKLYKSGWAGRAIRVERYACKRFRFIFLSELFGDNNVEYDHTTLHLFLYYYFFLVSRYAMRLSTLGMSATIGPLYEPQMIHDGDCGATVE